MCNKDIKKKGFTLVELMVVVVVISIGIAGVANLVFRLFNQGRFIIAKFTAAGLLQEGVEIVRNIRDSNWIRNDVWDVGLVEGNYEADWNDQQLSLYSGSGRLLKNDAGLYSYDSGTDTKFKRLINIQRPAGDIIRVTVSVSWSEAGQSNAVSAVEELYNWRQ